MKNVNINFDDDILTIVVDTRENFGQTKSGKTDMVASSEGFVWENDFGINVNVIKRRK